MNDTDLRSVLRCGLCNKPFDKPASLKRHGYYCRSRKTGVGTRARSCVSCAARKARCDNTRPACSKCASRGMDCHYPMDSRKDQASRTHRANGVSTAPKGMTSQPIEASSSAMEGGEARVEDQSTSDDTLSTPDSSLLGMSNDFNNWRAPNFDFVDLMDIQTGDDEVSISHNSPTVSSFATSAADRLHQTQQNIAFSNMSIPAIPTFFIRSLIPRPTVNQAQMTANAMLHTLKTYPSKMLHSDNLPPFIHRSLLSPEFNDVDNEPIANCISLVHMLSSGFRGSRKLFWKNVRLECERIFEEHTMFSKWALLTSMQAVAIYIFIRVGEGETEHNNLDQLLVLTVTALAQHFGNFNEPSNVQCVHSNDRKDETWKDWVFEESTRRICVVYRVLDMLFYFEPAALCNLKGNLVIAPLPARKQLWEATNETVWKTESDSSLDMHTSLGLAASGELVEIDEGKKKCIDAMLSKPHPDARLKGNANWDEWCSGRDGDGFGMLVMLAASLIT